VLSVAGALAFFALWTAIAMSGLVQAQFLPTPLAVLDKFVDLTKNPFVGYTLQQHLLSSFGRFASGFVLAALVGVPLGLMMGWYRWLDDAVTRRCSRRCGSSHRSRGCRSQRCGSAPASAAPVLIIFSGRVSPMPHQCLSRCALRRDALRRSGATLGAPNWRVICEVLLPASVPSIVAGLRIGAGLGWQSLIRRRADRRVERHRLSDGQGPEQHQHVDRHGRNDRHRRRRLHRRRAAAAAGSGDQPATGQVTTCR
jgi:NitT/TauT family transport system permease protein